MASLPSTNPLDNWRFQDFVNRHLSKLAELEQTPSKTSEDVLLQQLVANRGDLLPGYPLLFDFEWEVVDGRSDFGVGDAVFTDGKGSFAVVEIKYLNFDASGHTAKEKKRRQKQEVIQQAHSYAKDFAEKYSVKVTPVTCLNQKDGSLEVTFLDPQPIAATVSPHVPESSAAASPMVASVYHKQEPKVSSFGGLAAMFSDLSTEEKIVGAVAAVGLAWLGHSAYKALSSDETPPRAAAEPVRYRSSVEPVPVAVAQVAAPIVGPRPPVMRVPVVAQRVNPNRKRDWVMFCVLLLALFVYGWYCSVIGKHG